MSFRKPDPYDGVWWMALVTAGVLWVVYYAI
jgi:hypothetical protein